MNKQAIWAVAKKDMLAIKESIQIWLPILILPIVFCLVLPAGLILAIKYFGNAGNVDQIISLLEQLPPGSIRDSILQWDEQNLQILYFFLVYLFAPFFLMIPVMISSVVAASSFVGEKERKTLESLLYTPIDIASLFWGKLLSAFIPAIGLTLISALGYMLVVNILSYDLFGQFIFPQANWLVLIFWVVPTVSLFAIFLNVYVSARVKGFQEAYQLGGLVILPIIALFVSQMAGIMFFSSLVLGALGFIMLVVDLFLVYKTTKDFDRNRLFMSQVK
ncbi:MAG: ABC transporter permease subunit [Firmicutes bacterium]|nr:ABC transporter permease subunit [Bacillota bacterium]